MRLEAGEGCARFTCSGCGREMIAIGVEDAPSLCGRCTVMPGWTDGSTRRVADTPEAEGGDSALDPDRVLH